MIHEAPDPRVFRPLTGAVGVGASIKQLVLMTLLINPLAFTALAWPPTWFGFGGGRNRLAARKVAHC